MDLVRGVCTSVLSKETVESVCSSLLISALGFSRAVLFYGTKGPEYDFAVKFLVSTVSIFATAPIVFKVASRGWVHLNNPQNIVDDVVRAVAVNGMPAFLQLGFVMAYINYQYHQHCSVSIE